ncbi:hypothetical protein H0H93_014218 [Arthromyces matolae]|nr:hypothetical protein H0H93_014218 [Arthromyces matolae]
MTVEGMITGGQVNTVEDGMNINVDEIEIESENAVIAKNAVDPPHERKESEAFSLSTFPSPRLKPSAEQSSMPPEEPTSNSALPPHPSQQLPELELELPSSPPPVEDVMAARRAKREAIRAKYTGVASVASVDATPSPSSAVQPPPSSSHVSNAVTRAPSLSGTTAPSGGELAEGKRASMSASPSPDDFALAKDGDTDEVPTQENISAEQISAADYDPSLDRREDEQRRIREPPRPIEPIHVEEDEVEEEEEEDWDDMFAIATTTKKIQKVKKTPKQGVAPALVTTNLDAAADPEGYYSVILGEQLDGRYQVFSSIGKGMFANVVRARIIQGTPNEVGKEVAIKIVRCQESMYRAGQKEAQILNKLKEADPDDKKHIVRLERTFEHRGHLCLVFESMSMNLRDVVKRFGKDIGLNIRAVRAYAHQLFLALSLLRKANIMHADIKPDNILVNEQKTLLKLCDLGSASDASENDITPYLVSRFYRAPEIILGVPYDPALDIWSIGCTLYELYTGKILFPGRSNNQMLLLMMELKGRFNGKMIKRAKFGDMYFDEMGGFESVETDRVTGAATSAKLKDDENKLILSFIDLLDKCLALDPGRRITPKEALSHPFLAYVDSNTNHAIIKVDNTSTVPYNEKRNTVRISTDDRYGLGTVWVADMLHIPYGCSVWPAWWSQAPDWPIGGEIDTLEGVNLGTQNQMGLHTEPGCLSVNPNLLSTSKEGSGDCSYLSNNNSGCIVTDTNPASYGQGFAAAGGGVFITEFATSGISIWFFARANVPSSLTSNASSIDTSTFGTPSGNWPSTNCTMSQFFEPQNLILDITLCGDFAGDSTIFNETCTGVCYTDYVMGNGSNYATAYFEIASIRIFSSDGTNNIIDGSSTTSNASATSTGSGATHTGAALAQANKNMLLLCLSFVLGSIALCLT